MRRSMDPENQIQAFLTQLGLSIAPESLPLFVRAFTHSSWTYEQKLSSLENYERLEFLGDAVLKIVISHYLFRRFPFYREGELTKIRAVIVSDATLARLAAEMNMGDIMILGPSEARSGGRRKTSNLACAFEAFLGALFLTGHMDFATGMLENLLEEIVTHVDLDKTKDNFKAVLQEMTQGDGLGLPEYVTVKEEGPAHNRQFYVDVLIHGEVMGHGTGKSKKEAQQMAARVALQCLNALPDVVDLDCEE